MSSQLYYKESYLNHNANIIANGIIIEYDLKSANTSLCREYGILEEEKIAKIEALPKKERVVAIGLLMKKDKEMKKKLLDAFVDMRRRFFELNALEDKDILSIKKDAIYCLRSVKYTEIGACKFVPKHEYTAYLYINRTELYYGRKDMLENTYQIDVKGIGDDNVALHENYMLDFLKTFFYHLENGTIESQLRYLRNFIDRYKHRELDIEYYREFGPRSIFRLLGGTETYREAIFIPTEQKTDVVDINYNYFQILLPLLKMIV